MDDAWIHQSCRRAFLARASLLATTPFMGWARIAAAEPPPETAKIRLLATPAICIAPEFIAESFLADEGFTDIQYVKFDVTIDGGRLLESNAVDIMSIPPGNILTGIDSGKPFVTLSGEHLGCYELFGHERVRSIRDLKGKRIAIDGLGGPSTFSCRPWRRTSAWIPARMSTGSSDPPRKA